MAEKTSDGSVPPMTVTDSNVLWEGPLFADEVGWAPSISSDLIDRYELRSRRIILGKAANKGVTSIYFRPPHHEPALIRYANRYRPLIELLLRQGLSGEERLINQGWMPEEIDYFYEIIPGLGSNEYSPIVYRLVQQSLTTPKYLDLAELIEGRSRFKPSDLSLASSKIDKSDLSLLGLFIRHHLIEKIDSSNQTVKSRGKRTATTTGVETEAEYVLTPQGKESIPAMLSVYDRVIRNPEFQPLDAPIEAATNHLPKEGHTNDNPSDLVTELLDDLEFGSDS